MSVIQKLLGQSPSLVLGKTQEKTYLEAIQLFRDGDWDSTVRQSSLAAAEASSPKASLPFYRLWVESLFQAGDSAALKELVQHLRKRAVREENGNAFRSLAIIAHEHIGEKQAMSLYARSFKPSGDCWYELEAADCLADSGIISRKQNARFIVASKARPHDYIHLIKLADLFKSSEESLVLIYEFLDKYSHGRQWGQIESCSRELKAGHPNRAGALIRPSGEVPTERYRREAFLYHLARFQVGDLSSAVKGFQALHKMVPQDVDVVSMHAISATTLAIKESDATLAQKSMGLLGVAIELRNENGYPNDDLIGKKGQLVDAFPDLAISSSGSSRVWLVKLSISAAQKLSLTEGKIYRAIGALAEPGDLVLFCVQSQTQTRLGRRASSRSKKK